MDKKFIITLIKDWPSRAAIAAKYRIHNGWRQCVYRYDLIASLYYRACNFIKHVGYAVAGVKSATIEKKFIITLMKDPPSRATAAKCMQSIRQHGGGDIEYFAAIDEHSAASVLKEHGIAWTSLGNRDSQGARMGCFASHFLLWLKCIECNEPIMILECDALLVRSIPHKLRFRHVINLADGKYRKDCLPQSVLKFLDTQTLHKEIYYGSQFMPGLVAYAISPQGAQRLVKRAKATSACEADMFIRKPVVDIVECIPLPATLNVDYPSYIERQAQRVHKLSPG